MIGNLYQNAQVTYSFESFQFDQDSTKCDARDFPCVRTGSSSSKKGTVQFDPSQSLVVYFRYASSNLEIASNLALETIISKESIQSWFANSSSKACFAYPARSGTWSYSRSSGYKPVTSQFSRYTPFQVVFELLPNGRQHNGCRPLRWALHSLPRGMGISF